MIFGDFRIKKDLVSRRVGNISNFASVHRFSVRSST